MFPRVVPLSPGLVPIASLPTLEALEPVAIQQRWRERHGGRRQGCRRRGHRQGLLKHALTVPLGGEGSYLVFKEG